VGPHARGRCRRGHPRGQRSRPHPAPCRWCGLRRCRVHELSHDHLDDYADMDEYFEAKLSLFTPERSRKAVVSLDTAAGAAVVERTAIHVVTISSTPGVTADWVVTVTDEQPDSTGFTLASAVHGTVSTRVPVIGRHMAANGGLAIAMLVEAGIPLEEIRSVLDRDGSIVATLPGRS